MTGHGADVKSARWHPRRALVATGSKDNMLKLWDPRSGDCVMTLHGHKNTVLRVRWHPSREPWLISGGRDATIRLYDIRQGSEIMTWRNPGKEVCSIEWHPLIPSAFATGNSEGAVAFWSVLPNYKSTYVDAVSNQQEDGAEWTISHRMRVSNYPNARTKRALLGKLLVYGGALPGSKRSSEASDRLYKADADSTEGNQPLYVMPTAHETNVWAMDFHPLGHVLATGSNDQTTKFWCRLRPGEPESERYEKARVPPQVEVRDSEEEIKQEEKQKGLLDMLLESSGQAATGAIMKKEESATEPKEVKQAESAEPAVDESSSLQSRPTNFLPGLCM